MPLSKLLKLFRGSDKRRINRIIEESHKKAARELGPLSALGKVIVLGSQKCRDTIKPRIVASDEKERAEKELYALHEFVYFFAHFTMRLASQAMTESERQILGRHLAKYLESVCVDLYFQSWSDELRRKLAVEFRANLQKAEVEYGTCATVNVFTSANEADALFMTLGENVASIIGCRNDDELRFSIATLALAQIASPSLLRLILDFKRDSMELPDNY